MRLITAGTLTEDTLLDARRNNYLAAIVRARASVAGRGGAVRARLSRHFDRRIPRHGMRPARAWRRDRAHRAGRDHRVGRALWRRRAGALSAHAAGDAADARRVRRRDRGAAACGLLRGRHDGRVRHVLAAGADRGRGLHHLRGAHAARHRPPLSPPTREAAGTTPADRCGDARQSRTDAHALGRAARLARATRSTAP